MDLDRLKEACHVQWCPPSMVIHMHNPKDVKSIIAIGLLERMNEKSEHNDGHRRKDERLCIKNTMKTVNQLAKFMNDTCFLSLGFRVKVGYGKLQKNEPCVALKCCRGAHQCTSRSTCNETASFFPQSDAKCFWSLTLRCGR